MEDATEQTETAHWKRKYYDQIAELDRLEKEWQATESLLARAVSRLAGMASGQEHVIDPLIEEIRSSVSGGVDAARLEPILDRLFDTIVHDSNDAAELAEVTCALLDRIELPANMEAERADLRQRLTEDESPSHAQVSATLRLIAQALTEREQRATDPASPLDATVTDHLSGNDGDAFAAIRSATVRLLQRCSTSRSAPDLPTDLIGRVQSATTEQELDAGIDTLVNTLFTQTGQDDGSAATRDTLLKLLDQLEVPADFEPAAETLRTRVNSAATQAQCQPLAADLAQFVNTLRGQLQIQKRELQDFLVRVNERIESLVDLLGQGNAELENQSSNQEEFDHGIDEQIRSIRDAVHAATDTDQLKSTLEQRLDDITRRLLDRRRAENERLRQDRERIERMRGRLSELERESTALRATVDRKTEEAMTDPLTGIPNRLAYDKCITEEFQRWQRFGVALSIGLIDSDNFKRINDTCGHQAGDNALRVIADLIQSRLRSIDFVARYGGEEFVVVFPGTAHREAFAVLDELRARVAMASFHYRGQRIAITVSGGVAGFGPHDTINSTLERADSALYTAKRKGRNRCESGEDARFEGEE